MMTIFSPLTLAFKLAGETVIEHLRQHPACLHAGLATLTETTAHFAQAALDAGANGLFFATQLASHRWLTPDEYAEFGEQYDKAILDTVAEGSAITVLHLHGKEVFFDLANRYPIHAVSWHDRETPPNLREATDLTDRAFVTGLDRTLLGRGPLSAIHNQVREALHQTGRRRGRREGGHGLILAPSCVIPTTAPAERLQAVQDSLEAGKANDARPRCRSIYS
jgi:uroporphyrinogen decarboxylase